jgi:hypothetical protein
MALSELISVNQPTISVSESNTVIRFPNQSRLAWITVGASAFALALAFSYALIASLQPSERVFGSLPRVDIPKLAPGSFAYVQNPASIDDWPSELLFVKLTDGELRVFDVPTHRGRFTMPDLLWARNGPVCRDFGPDFRAGQIACTDPHMPDGLRERLRWSLIGKSTVAGQEDMPIAHGCVVGDEFVVGGCPRN